MLWYGKWPQYIRAFLESCRWNSTIDWLIITDQDQPADCPPNVRIRQMSFDSLRQYAGGALGIVPQWKDSYKLCDVRPALGFVFSEEIKAYDFWGYGDTDVIYGNIRAIYNGDVWQHDVISSHEILVAGHFCLLANKAEIVKAFMKVRGWKAIIADARHRAFDEVYFSHMFMAASWRQPFRRVFAPYVGGALLREQFSSDHAPLRWIDGSKKFPSRWFWREGRLTAEGAGDREFLYLHLSAWQSARWNRAKEAPWKDLEKIDQLPPEKPSAFMISRNGIQQLEEPAEII